MEAIPGSHAENVLSIEINVTATLGEGRIRLGEALNLVPGTVLKLDQPCDQALRINAAGQCVGSGRTVKIGDQLGVKVELS